MNAEPSDLGRVSSRMAWAFGVLFSINSLCTCILASMVNATWEDMGTEKRTLMGIAILGNWTGILMAFLSKTVARASSGKPIVPRDETDIFTKGPGGSVVTATK